MCQGENTYHVPVHKFTDLHTFFNVIVVVVAVVVFPA